MTSIPQHQECADPSIVDGIISTENVKLSPSRTSTRMMMEQEMTSHRKNISDEGSKTSMTTLVPLIARAAAATTTTTTTTTTGLDATEGVPKPPLDPYRELLPPDTVQEGDFFLLVFGDGRQIFGKCVRQQQPQQQRNPAEATNIASYNPRKKPSNGVKMPLKIGKTCYPTYNLEGLPYGTVLEQRRNLLIPLPPNESLIPVLPLTITPSTTPPPSSSLPSHPKNEISMASSTTATTEAALKSISNTTTDTISPVPNPFTKDNRNIVDNNTSQQLNQDDLRRLRESGLCGSVIVQQIIENSQTFTNKTDYAQAKYVTRKQLKYQPRCRLVRCTGATVCEALFLKDPRRIHYMREDTLGQILSYANVTAGGQVLVWDTGMGVVTGALAQRMGGYGIILSVYSGKQHPFVEMIDKFNLSFAENCSIRWVHSGDLRADFQSGTQQQTVQEEEDLERKEREGFSRWPCPLQDHTRRYLESMQYEDEQRVFLARRAARFARKLTRYTPIENKKCLESRPCDSVIIVTRYDPTETLFKLLPYLAPSCPFVVYCEFMEPLSECFRQLQVQNLAINLRLSSTWAREYQVVPDRTHPTMNMSQSGGFLLTGIKLDPIHGIHELSEETLNEIRQQLGSRRQRRGGKPKKDSSADDIGIGPAAKRIRLARSDDNRDDPDEDS